MIVVSAEIYVTLGPIKYDDPPNLGIHVYLRGRLCERGIQP